MSILLCFYKSICEKQEQINKNLNDNFFAVLGLSQYFYTVKMVSENPPLASRPA